MVILDFLETPEMEVVGVIGRFASLRGSTTAGIMLLSEVNHLLVKGKDVTDEEWAEVFTKLEGKLN